MNDPFKMYVMWNTCRQGRCSRRQTKDSQGTLNCETQGKQGGQPSDWIKVGGPLTFVGTNPPGKLAKEEDVQGKVEETVKVKDNWPGSTGTDKDWMKPSSSQIKQTFPPGPDETWWEFHPSRE